jgi:glycosyltransferase involved in cell wall biosynthesis
MKIGIDARFWSQTGVGRYIREIVGELAKLDTVNDYVVYVLEEDVAKVSLPGNFKLVSTTIRWHSFGEQIVLPLLYLRERFDVLVVLNFNVPVLYPGTLVTTVHDLTLLRTRTGNATKLPFIIYTLKYIAGCLTHFMAVKRSKKVFTVSKYVKNDIVKTFRVDPAKIILTPNAVDSHFYRRAAAEVTRVLHRNAVGQPYLFYVGNACVHKNLPRLLKAFALLVTEYPELTLVLGGKIDFNYQRLQRQCVALGLQAKVKFIGYVAEDDLPCLYTGAEVYVNPSIYEGFGIQVLEAFACGCKVVCSNTTSLPEVGGALADYFDPLDPQAMADAIKKALVKHDPDFAAKATKHVAGFSWRASAQTILATIQSL